ncbi:hypothetical protein EXIGLDRAFT_759771 [Exidia glandulosa HHB12029]|uniref:Uncharacterized protein n=1 Tax=Exidia glandulosa HHB12029 TaxID=1314781 RepID=A0A165PTI0_EXIGL|nr:hypothetical protein EXIGLDRAFT_759771 [Exidia glandulosa HHB12029]
MSLLTPSDVEEIGRHILEAQWELPKDADKRETLRTIVKAFATTHVPALLRCIPIGKGTEWAAFRYLSTVFSTALAEGLPPHMRLITDARKFLKEHLPNFPEGPDELKRTYVLTGSNTTQNFVKGKGQLLTLDKSPISLDTPNFKRPWREFQAVLEKLSDIQFLYAQLPLEQLMPHSESDVIDQWAVKRDEGQPVYPMQELVFEHLAEAGIKFTANILPGAGPENPKVTVSRPDGSRQSDPKPKAGPADDAKDPAEKKAYLRMDSVGVGWGMLSKTYFEELRLFGHGPSVALNGNEHCSIGAKNLRTILQQAVHYGVVVDLEMVLLTDYGNTVLLWITEVPSPDGKSYTIKWMHLDSMVIPKLSKPGVKHDTASGLTARSLLLFVIWMGHKKLKTCMEKFGQNLPKK